MRRIHPGLKKKKKKKKEKKEEEKNEEKKKREKKEKKREEFHLDSNYCGFICAGINFVGGYK